MDDNKKYLLYILAILLIVSLGLFQVFILPNLISSESGYTKEFLLSLQEILSGILGTLLSFVLIYCFLERKGIIRGKSIPEKDILYIGNLFNKVSSVSLKDEEVTLLSEVVMLEYLIDTEKLVKYLTRDSFIKKILKKK